MTTRDPNKKIEDITERIRKLEAQKKQLEARSKEKERKERTRRLIQIGAIMDSMGINTIELAEKFKNHFENNDKSKEWLEKLIQSNKNA